MDVTTVGEKGDNMEGVDNKAHTLSIKEHKYLIKFYFSKTDEYIGYASFVDENALVSWEKNTPVYNLILRENEDCLDGIDGSALRENVTKEENYNYDEPKGSVMQHFVRKIWVNKYLQLDSKTNEYIVVE